MNAAAKGIFGTIVAVMTLSAPLAAADSTIQGIVTDASGKPVRGATVSVTAGVRTVSRFTQADGHYDITVAPGSYDLVVDAFGYGIKRQPADTSKAGSTDVQLKAVATLDLARLTGAEIESLLPDTPESRVIRSHCIDCHSFPTVIHRRGQSVEEWKEFLPNMTKGATGEPFAHTPDPILSYIAQDLAKYFGPDSPYFSPDADPITPDKVKHVGLSDEAAKATVVQFDVPTKISRPHSIEVDTNSNVAWFAEESFYGNKIGRFDISTEKFTEYPLPKDHLRPHTGGVASDGTYWVALANTTNISKLASCNPKTGEVKLYDWPEEMNYQAHTIQFDHKGNIWFSGSPAGELWTFDVETKKFKAYKSPYPDPTYPKGSRMDWEATPGQPKLAPRNVPYDVTADNDGNIWFSMIALGTLARLNPNTGEVKYIRPEGTVSIRGIQFDPDDNLWFGDFHGHRLGRINAKTLQVSFFKPPTPNATVYGVTYNKADGNVWYADLNGNHVTRFNRKTEQFTEFPVPQRPDHAYDRFIGADAQGRMWFTEYFGDRIGFVDPSGKSAPQMASK
jgi:virginiamycin B lyase